MKVYLKTFGCRANQYDSERVRAATLAGGCEIVDDVAVADVAVFNSCAVTSEAERDARKAIRRAASDNPRLRTIVMGCAAALPGNDVSIGGLPSVVRVVPGADIAGIADVLGLPQSAAVMPQSSARAVLRIQDGCDEHCTFCATTIARGANRSRSIRELVDEARELARHHAEIVITGTHIGTYGLDNGSSLGSLMQALVAGVPAARFRLSSIEATEVDPALFELLVDGSGRLAPHLHAPLQSGSDRILRRMGRHWYTVDAYAKAVERIAGRLSVFALGADVIVGFPGETEQDFDATMRLVDRLPFTYLHVFTYSPRPGTAATRLPDPVSSAAARERSSSLRHMAETKSRSYRQSRAGSRADVVVVSGPPDREGMTEDFLAVTVRGVRHRGELFSATLSMVNESLVAA